MKSKNKERDAAEKLVKAINSDMNVVAEKRLEMLLKKKMAKRIKEVLN